MNILRRTAVLEGFNQQILILNRVWNKKKRLAILSPRIPSERQKTYPYKESLKKQILMRHLTNNFGMGRKAVMEKHAPRRISSHL
ncbi:hypothetical protein MAR_010625 [Mya arenaria]|uniref:Uncharacterized protein n=1 Tax=Mya arenaria TaxID=6604 RepID=A0ABY7E522_MYAAR|nr:hypothetical protein MAR_010625 [Mya arenaria]